MLMPTSFTSIDSKSANSAFSFGAGTTTTERFSLSGTDIDSLPTTDTYRIARTDKVLTMIDAGTSSVLKSADFVTMDTDGFTINYDTTTGAAGLCAYAALKG